MMKKIAFRVDGNPDIGMGHIQRCSVIAQEMQRHGHIAVFICENSTKKYINSFREKFCFKFIRSRRDLSPFEDFDVIVIDHLSLDRKYEQSIKNKTQSMMVVIDDLCSKKHACDILLNPNPGFHAENYLKLIPAHCKILLGPTYTLIQSGILRLADTYSRNPVPVRNILINFGGGDQHGMCKFSLKSLLNTSFRGKVSVVLGHSKNGLDELRKIKEQSSLKIDIKGFVNMTRELQACDLVIGSASSSVWERCVLGKPSILISLADNQLAAAKYLSKHQAALYLGSRKTISQKSFSKKIQNLLDDPARIQLYAKHARKLTDGKGVLRLVNEIEISAENADQLNNDYRKNYMHWNHAKQSKQDFNYSDDGVEISGVHLPWDTQVLGKKSARITHIRCSKSNIKAMPHALSSVLKRMNQDGIQFIDVRIGTQAHPFIPILQKEGFQITDRMNIYVSEKEPSKTIQSGKYLLSTKRPTPKQFLEMKKFGMKSFIHSRIYNDKNIPKSTADSFYEKLLENVWKNRSATFVSMLDKHKIVGFCIGTEDFVAMNGSIGILSMIAVHPSYAGRGIGAALLHSFLNMMHKKYDLVEIGTQTDNKGANALYRSFDLPIKAQLFTLHHHLKTVPRKYTQQEIEKEYDRSSHAKHEFQKVKWASKGKMINRFRRALHEIPFQKSSTWLDVGSGTGSFQALVKKKYPHIQATGIDVSGKLIKHAKKKNAKLHVRYKKSDFLDFTLGRYDLITSIGVLQKTNMDIGAFFKKAYSLLIPGGKVFIDTKHANWEMFKNSKLAPDSDISWFGTQELMNAAKNAKFRNIGLRGFLPESNTVVKPEKSHTIFMTATKGRS